MATAVEESASPPPSTIEAGPLQPVTAITVYATTASVATTCVHGTGHQATLAATQMLSALLRGLPKHRHEDQRLGTLSSPCALLHNCCIMLTHGTSSGLYQGHAEASSRAGESQETGQRHHTWALPRPNTYFCIWRRRSRLSSRPMLNSKKTTPSSARCLTASTSLIIPSACGPMRAPPAYTQGMRR